MKKQIITSVLAMALIIPFACKKKDNTTPDTPASTTSSTTTGGSTAGVAGTFTWTENGGSVQTADSAFWTTGTWGTGVRALKGSFANYFEINWATQNNTTVGAKSLSTGNFTFLKGTATYTNASSQTLNVSAFASNLMSGNFTTAVSGGTITAITGGFTAIKYKP